MRRNKNAFAKTTGLAVEAQSFDKRDKSALSQIPIDMLGKNTAHSSEGSVRFSRQQRSQSYEIAELQSEEGSNENSAEHLEKVQLFRELRFLASLKGRKLTLEGTLPREKRSQEGRSFGENTPNFIVTNSQSGGSTKIIQARSSEQIVAAHEDTDSAEK